MVKYFVFNKWKKINCGVLFETNNLEMAEELFHNTSTEGVGMLILAQELKRKR